MDYMNFNNICKKFKKKKVLIDINLTIHEGSIFGLIGENGAGKSTLMKISSGLIYPDKGQVEVIKNGQKVEKNFSKRKITALIEQPSFYSNMSGIDNVICFCNLYEKKITKKEMNFFFDLVDLSKYKKVKVKKYSMGMKQRLALIQCFILDTDILILDEPFNGLDPKIVIAVKNHLYKLRDKGKIIFITSHILSDMEKMCDHIAIIKNGKLNNVKLNYASHKKFYIKVNDLHTTCNLLYQYQSKIYDEKQNIIKITTSETELQYIIKKLILNNIIISKINPEERDLEDLFIEYNSESEENI